MRGGRDTIFQHLALLFVVLVLGVFIPPVVSASGSHMEDETKTRYGFLFEEEEAEIETPSAAQMAEIREQAALRQKQEQALRTVRPVATRAIAGLVDSIIMAKPAG
mmetsp:Transcript_5092/g.12718  ORF Transcript_5092/g.12718 Transcript_5092/m.12718 type:complete len:106 (+) Transcript_5092:44-361(+)|eukprot:CAMPEP_0174234224 /NCGR_PEP_ID=MMETSP0417-20130205/4042_1 /TAXON_ID=242541 /ORGANISM="Mayorella sp, Strain BSH-02190019" /LENGTH=105 /DNA_ID=CAMNT_0015312559 /DNA_START=12 /DNA_END=329 /DNA_ORIENTATION=-